MTYVKGLDDNQIYSEMVHWLRKNMSEYIFLDNDVQCYPSEYGEANHKDQIDAYFRDCRKHLIEHLKLEEVEK